MEIQNVQTKHITGKIKIEVAMEWIRFIRSSFVISKSDILSKHAKRFNFDKLSLHDRKLFRQIISDQLD